MVNTFPTKNKKSTEGKEKYRFYMAYIEDSSLSTDFPNQTGVAQSRANSPYLWDF